MRCDRKGMWESCTRMYRALLILWPSWCTRERKEQIEIEKLSNSFFVFSLCLVAARFVSPKMRISNEIYFIRNIVCPRLEVNVYKLHTRVRLVHIFKFVNGGIDSTVDMLWQEQRHSCQGVLPITILFENASQQCYRSGIFVFPWNNMIKLLEKQENAVRANRCSEKNKRKRRSETRLQIKYLIHHLYNIIALTNKYPAHNGDRVRRTSEM